MDKDFDFDELAAKFDRILPILEPVTERIADHLGPLTPGTELLDLACGTGEPGLTLLARNPGARLRGVDAAPAMAAVAAKKAAAKGLPDVRFEVMDSLGLGIEDRGVDAVVSRFGVLSLVPDPRVEAREVARVLRLGGRFVIATWDAGSKNIVSYALAAALRPWLRPPVVAALERQEHFAMPGRREAWLSEAGFADVRSELFSWSVGFADEARLWAFADDPMFLRSVAGDLDTAQLAHVRETMFDLVTEYRQADGSYRLPYACRILWGVR
ncbi:hypothetical protein Val02_89400 [Virgisporangium aliadipatigenens]|uniref:Methyltransferase domain-containing protein n=1 Tax=Virgisporangium aliadipatigenens TaxID=741659 RepID=A0A8J3YUB6_9ACTN|nr:class I SAM-dependent methyltransferase [Virgisporangium aliadipatigenens]GIJ52054.1 hypothetical protein Val02_89400 [Virgisporangium aliadipatigenens]